MFFEELFMDKIGFLKSFDNLGRIVIPKELRDRYMLEKTVEVVTLEEGVLIRNPKYILVKKEDINVDKSSL